jgi:hypothetical protein
VPSDKNIDTSVNKTNDMSFNSKSGKGGTSVRKIRKVTISKEAIARDEFTINRSPEI